MKGKLKCLGILLLTMAFVFAPQVGAWDRGPWDTSTRYFVASAIPQADDSVDLGTSSLEWKDLYIDGTANIDSLVADTADINAGTVDATIGGTTAAVGNFTSIGVAAATFTPGDDVEIRGPVGTGATGAGMLRLSTSELTIVDNDYLGRIDFIAPLETGADATAVAASIWGEAEAEFTASVNTTALVFATGTSEAATEEMRLTGAGLLQIGSAAGSGNVNITPQSAIMGLLINQDSDARALYIDSENTTNAVLDVNGKLVIYANQDLTGGMGLDVRRSIDEAGSLPLARIRDTAGTASTQPTLFIDHDGTGGATGYALHVDSENAAGPAALIDGAATALTLTSAAGIALDASGDYAVQLQNIPDLASKGPSYWFDGSDDVITVADSDTHALGTSDFSFVIGYNVSDVDEASLFGIYDSLTDRMHFKASYDNFTFRVEVGDVAVGAYNATGSAIKYDVNDVVCFVSDRDAVKGALYINGEAISLTENTAMAETSLDITGDFLIGYDGFASRYSGNISRLLQFNLALSADEVRALSSGAPVPYKYVGASQTEMITDSDNQDFGDESINEWVVLRDGDGTCDYFDGPASEYVGRLTVGATPGTYTAGTLPTTEITTFQTGKIYKITADIYLPSGNNNWSSVVIADNGFSASWEAVSSTGATVATEDSWQTIEKVYSVGSDVTGDILVQGFSTTTGDLLYFDNITVTQIGAVLQLEQDGITGSEWADKSGNGLVGTVSGAIATNLDAMQVAYIPAVDFEYADSAIAEINGTEIFGSGMTDDDYVTLSYKPIESLGIDVNRPLYVQVVWAGIDGTTGQGNTFIVLYDTDAIESGVLTTPATALDTVLVEDTENDTPYVIQKTAKGIIDAGSLTSANMIAFQIEAAVVDDAQDPGVWFMGLLLSQ